jgi:hypothetical protein
MLSRRHMVILAAVAAFLAGAVALDAAFHADGHGQDGMTRVSVSVGTVTEVDLQAVPGQLSVSATRASRTTLTGELDWTRHAPAAAIGRSADRLSLFYRCAKASPCTANWRLVVPWHAAVVLGVPAGRVIVTGLAGSLRITADSADVSATGLACPVLDAVITSGHLEAAFRAPPRQVGISLTSAQATVLLPASVAYAVSDNVVRGYIRVGIAESGSSARTLTARVVSGELELLPEGQA